jgi:hypothetical protein
MRVIPIAAPGGAVLELSLFASVGWSAVAVVVACWLVVSFASREGARRRAGWLGATAMYVAFVCLFGSLFRRAWAGDSTLGMLGLGLMLAFFSAGFVLAVPRALRAFAGREAGKVESATH